MKNMKVWVAIAVVAVLGAGAFAQAKKVSIDMRFTAKGLDAAKDYFNWVVEGKKVNDKFDAAKRDEAHGTTGASAAGSTAGFDVVYRDGNKKTTMPVAIRHLCLFPVSAPPVGPDDAFTVIEEGKALVIRFFNRGVAYEIRTDSTKKVDMSNCAKSAAVGESVGGAFVLKPEYVKAGGDPQKYADADWTKITPALKADVPASDVQFKYDGKLTLAYANGVLTMKGDLALKK